MIFIKTRRMPKSKTEDLKIRLGDGSREVCKLLLSAKKKKKKRKTNSQHFFFKNPTTVETQNKIYH